MQPCIDFAHLHARPGDGSMNSYDEWARAFEAYGNALGDAALKDLSAHLSGIEYGDKGEKNHVPLPESDLDLGALLKALKEFGCAGRMIESPAMEDDALLVQRRWAELAGENYPDA